MTAYRRLVIAYRNLRMSAQANPRTDAREHVPARHLLVLVGAASLALASCSHDPGPVVNADRVKLIHERLQPAVLDLSSVGNSLKPGATAAKFTTCYIDNEGDLYQPEVSRTWSLNGEARSADPGKTTPAGRAELAKIATELQSHGWSGRADPDQEGAIDLYKSYGTYRVHIGAQVFDDSINTWATTTPRRACRTP
jgi:hypothetical protein